MKWIEEAFYLRLPPGPPMQGDIWDGLPMPYSDPPVCLGVLITPRCDLIHDKTPVINYIPLLSLEQFMNNQGGFALLEQEYQKTKDTLRRNAEPIGLLQRIDLQLPVDDILASFEADPNANASELKLNVARLKQCAHAFKDTEERLRRLDKLLKKSKLTAEEIAQFVPEKISLRHKLDIARNTVADLHFFPPHPPLLETAHVGLFREIVTCGIQFLYSAQSCISQPDWETLRQYRNTPDFQASQKKPERLLRLKSPFLESMMFRLGTLFGRVGVREIDHGDLSVLVRS